MNWQFSPFIVPLGAFAVAIVAIVSGMVGEVHKQRLRAEQRMTMVARGMSAEDIDKLLSKATNDGKRVKDPLHSLAMARRAGVILMASGLGVVIFGILLTWIVQDRDVLTVAGAGLIPIAIGIGFMVDYRMHKGDMARFGLELEAMPGQLPIERP